MILVVAIAGRNTRLPEINTHKCLIKFDNKTLIELLLDNFVSTNKIDLIVLCVGYKADEIGSLLKEDYQGVPIRYVFNPLFSETGVGYSVLLAAGYWVDQDCIIVDGDQLLHPDIVEQLVFLKSDSILCDSFTKPEMGEETIVIGENGVLDNLVWPANDLTKYSYDEEKYIIGEAIVAYKISKRSTRNLVKRLNKGEMIDALNEVLSGYVDIKGLPWIEIDTKEDLEKAKFIYEEIKDCLPQF